MKKILLPTLSLILVLVSSCSSTKDKMDDELIEKINEEIVSNIQEAIKEINDSSIQNLQIKLNSSNEKVDVSSSHFIGDDGNINVNVNVDTNDDLDTDYVAITAIITGTLAFLLCPVLIVAVICYFIYRSKRDRNRTINAAITAGYPLPKEFFYQYTPSLKLQSGFIYIAWATGLFLFFFIIGFRGIAYLALIPFIIGIGKIIGWYLYQKKENNNNKDIIIEEYHSDVK